MTASGTQTWTVCTQELALPGELPFSPGHPSQNINFRFSFQRARRGKEALNQWHFYGKAGKTALCPGDIELPLSAAQKPEDSASYEDYCQKPFRTCFGRMGQGAFQAWEDHYQDLLCRYSSPSCSILRQNK